MIWSEAERLIERHWPGMSATAERDGDRYVVALTPLASEQAPLLVAGDGSWEASSTESFADAIDQLARRQLPTRPLPSDLRRRST